jgi:hypothetical protein
MLQRIPISQKPRHAGDLTDLPRSLPESQVILGVHNCPAVIGIGQIDAVNSLLGPVNTNGLFSVISK